jgi:hypothetical protein
MRSELAQVVHACQDDCDGVGGLRGLERQRPEDVFRRGSDNAEEGHLTGGQASELVGVWRLTSAGNAASRDAVANQKDTCLASSTRQEHHCKEEAHNLVTGVYRSTPLLSEQVLAFESVCRRAGETSGKRARSAARDQICFSTPSSARAAVLKPCVGLQTRRGCGPLTRERTRGGEAWVKW